MMYTNEVRAQALALQLEGYSLRRARNEIFRTTGEAPDISTLAEWRKDSHEILREELEDAELRIARRADELVEAKMDRLGEDIDKARLPELVMAAGVYRDKTFKRAEIRRGPDTHNNFYLLVKQAEADIRAGRIPLSAPIEGGCSDTPRDE